MTGPSPTKVWSASTPREGSAPDRPARRPPTGPPTGVVVRLGLAAAVTGLALDQVTKQVAESLLLPGRMVEVLGGWLGWQLTYNQGGAFGLPAPSWFFLVVTVVVVAVVVVSLPDVRSRPQAVAFGLLLAGALGNAVDRVLRVGGPGDPRFLRGSVIDFVALELPVIGSWPRFNVADVCIVSGFLLLLGSVLREGTPPAGPPAWRPPDPSTHL